MTQLSNAVVPCRRVSSSTFRCVREALTNATVGRVLVSVNGGHPSEGEVESLLRLDGRVEVQIHDEDIGLYRNFESGLRREFEFTKFFAEDDSSPPGLVDQLAGSARRSDVLVLPQFIRREWSNGGFVGDRVAHENRLQLVPRPELDPSYLFGLWRTDYLLKYWPKNPFDWLDYCLVVRAMASSAVLQTDFGPLTLGFTPGRPPHAVSGEGHSSRRASKEIIAVALTARGGALRLNWRFRLMLHGLRFNAMGCALNLSLGLPQSAACRVWWAVRRRLPRANRLAT